MNTYPTEYSISPSSAYNSTPKLILSETGDGYQQSVPMGINNIDNKLTIVHTHLSMTEAETLKSILETYSRSGESVSFNNVLRWDGVSAVDQIKIKITNYTSAYENGVTQTVTVSAQEVWA